MHTLEKLLQIANIDEVWIDTDSVNIINIAKDYGYSGFKHFIRDVKYASNKTDGNTLLENEINNIKADIYIQVLCTSPFTKIESIKKCVDILHLQGPSDKKSVVGCAKEKYYLWKGEQNPQPLYNKLDIPNSNTLPDTIIETMSIYGIWKEEFEKSKTRIGSNPYLLTLEGEELIDINYEKDFKYANKFICYQLMQEQHIFEMLKIKLNSCIIADILQELLGNDGRKYILPNFQLNIKRKTLFGRIRPIQIRELNEGENSNDIYKCLNSYKTICRGDIIFVNNKVNNKAYFGDLNATIALSKHAQGTIVNGYTRDVNRTIDLDYPVFYKNNTCDDVKDFGTLDYFDKPVTIDNTKIHVNDLIFADVDGIVIIPRKLEKQVIEKCKEVIKNESRISESIITGTNIHDIIKKFGYF